MRSKSKEDRHVGRQVNDMESDVFSVRLATWKIMWMEGWKDLCGKG